MSLKDETREVDVAKEISCKALKATWGTRPWQHHDRRLKSLIGQGINELRGFDGHSGSFADDGLWRMDLRALFLEVGS